MSGHLIHSTEDLVTGSRWLASQDSRFKNALELVEPLSLRRKDGGFEALLSTIVSQQLSVASARAIWSKLESAGFSKPDALHNARDEDLRLCGLSPQKMGYARALVNADIDYTALHELSDEEVISTLSAVKGIGRWSAEIYLMFALGRADVFPAKDLGLQEGAQLLFGLAARPSEKQLSDMAMPWRPWRSVAAQILWAYYSYSKKDKG